MNDPHQKTVGHYFFKYSFIIFPTLFFLWIRLVNNTIYFSDTNSYFYEGYAILQGKLLYKDMFFTNLPLFPYISAFYFLLFGKNLLIYTYSGTLEAVASAFLIYYIVYVRIKNTINATISFLLFLFSTSVLTNSPGQVGVFTAIIFLLLGYIFWLKNRHLLTGLFLACCLLTKAYFAPVILPFFVMTFLKGNSKDTMRLIFSFGITCLLSIVPFVILASKEMVFDLFKYSVIKYGVYDKGGILNNFISTDFILFGMSLVSFYFFRKNLFFGLASLFFYLFFFLNKSMYSLYIIMIIPFLSIYAGILFKKITIKEPLARMTVIGAFFFYLVYTFFTFYSTSINLNKVENYENIEAVIMKDHPSYIYGTSFITTALAYDTKIPLLDNLMDTDDALFTSDVLNKTTTTKDAILKKTDVVAWGVQYYNGTQLITQIPNAAVDTKLLTTNCKLKNIFPFPGPYYINRLFLFSCAKND